MATSYQLPHTIKNKYGEEITFLRIEGKRVITEGFVHQPGEGPPMHVHFMQDESFTVVKGKIGHQILGQEPQYGKPGDTVFFKRGTPHRFWNAGEEALHITGWVDPADNLIFFLSTLYDALDRGENHRPELFDSAYLMHRYRCEYDLAEMPAFVKKVVVPVVYAIGVALGKYNKFKNAPQPIRKPATP